MDDSVYIIKNNFLEVHIGAYGATLQKIILLDKNGIPTDVLLGMNHIEDYSKEYYLSRNLYFGCIIGRYSNRISGGKFCINRKTYPLELNDGENHLHSGSTGFHQQTWKLSGHRKDLLILEYCSCDREGGYPGNMKINVHFILKAHSLKIYYEAACDHACPVSITHHPYFNLYPNDSTIENHYLKIYTDRMVYSQNLIPNGNIVPVTQKYDCTKETLLKKIIADAVGLDDCYAFDTNNQIKRMAVLYHPGSGIRLTVKSDYPGLQVYTGQHINIHNAKQGRFYEAFSGIALEPQYFPDSPNRPEFPSCILQPGNLFSKTIIYDFSIKL